MPRDPLLDQSVAAAGPQLPRLQAGQRLFNRRYELVRLLGAGGMGVVWLARDHTEEIDDVALKFLPTMLALQPAEMKRLRAEVQAGKKLRHPRLVATYSLEVDDGVVAIIMEHVEGQTLKEKLEAHERGFFEPDEIAGWVRDVCDALRYLHEEAKIIHRDLKPANIIIDASGCARLMDFGISQRIQESAARHSKASEGQADSGSTLAYASPQQLSGKPADKSDDIYSLGATLYDLLTGTPPFFRGGAAAVAHQIKTEAVTPIPERRAELVSESVNVSTGRTVAQSWEQVVLGCLEKERAKRPHGAAALWQLLDAPTQATPLKQSSDRPTKENRSAPGAQQDGASQEAANERALAHRRAVKALQQHEARQKAANERSWSKHRTPSAAIIKLGITSLSILVLVLAYTVAKNQYGLDLSLLLGGSKTNARLESNDANAHLGKLETGYAPPMKEPEAIPQTAPVPPTSPQSTKPRAVVPKAEPEDIAKTADHPNLLKQFETALAADMFEEARTLLDQLRTNGYTTASLTVLETKLKNKWRGELEKKIKELSDKHEFAEAQKVLDQMQQVAGEKDPVFLAIRSQFDKDRDKFNNDEWPKTQASVITPLLNAYREALEKREWDKAAEHAIALNNAVSNLGPHKNDFKDLMADIERRKQAAATADAKMAELKGEVQSRIAQIKKELARKEKADLVLVPLLIRDLRDFVGGESIEIKDLTKQLDALKAERDKAEEMKRGEEEQKRRAIVDSEAVVRSILDVIPDPSTKEQVEQMDRQFRGKHPKDKAALALHEWAWKIVSRFDNWDYVGAMEVAQNVPEQINDPGNDQRVARVSYAVQRWIGNELWKKGRAFNTKEVLAEDLLRNEDATRGLLMATQEAMKEWKDKENKPTPFYEGKADGKMGNETQNAILRANEFFFPEELPVTGFITKALLEKLGIDPH